MNEINDISGRIKELVEIFASGNNVLFAKMIGTNEANVRSYRTGRQPKFEILASIAENLEINCEWLLLGKGTYKKNDSLQSPPKTIPDPEPIKEERREATDPLTEKLFNIIAQKDEKIEEQAKTIGKLNNEIDHLKQTTSREREDAGDAVCADVG